MYEHQKITKKDFRSWSNGAGLIDKFAVNSKCSSPPKLEMNPIKKENQKPKIESSLSWE